MEKSEECFSITDDNEVDFTNFHNENIAKNPLSCFICDATFDDKNELLRHKLSHLGGLTVEESSVDRNIDALGSLHY